MVHIPKVTRDELDIIWKNGTGYIDDGRIFITKMELDHIVNKGMMYFQNNYIHKYTIILAQLKGDAELFANSQESHIRYLKFMDVCKQSAKFNIEIYDRSSSIPIPTNTRKLPVKNKDNCSTM
jgi:hypothetical protein